VRSAAGRARPSRALNPSAVSLLPARKPVPPPNPARPPYLPRTACSQRTSRRSTSHGTAAGSRFTAARRRQRRQTAWGKQLGLKRPAAPPRSSGSPHHRPPATTDFRRRCVDVVPFSDPCCCVFVSCWPDVQRAPTGTARRWMPPNFPFCGDLQGSNSW
jgi:hypothetical protein